uniref:Ig-like domain-containing protein n=1 Tax=Macrostomum lignano TaxID=282301 RepID=A0A1I8F7R1_9PLAT
MSLAASLHRAALPSRSEGARTDVPCKKNQCARATKTTLTPSAAAVVAIRVVVTIKYIQVKRRHARGGKTNKRYPCPFNARVRSTRASAAVKCVRRVQCDREKRWQNAAPPDVAGKQSLRPSGRKCRKHSAYKYQTDRRRSTGMFGGTCVIYKRETIARLLCRSTGPSEHYPCRSGLPEEVQDASSELRAARAGSTGLSTIATSTVKKRCSGRICTLQLHPQADPLSRVVSGSRTALSRKPRKVQRPMLRKEELTLVLESLEKARRCKIVWREEAQAVSQEPCKKRKCRYQLSYHTTKCVQHNFRTITTKYRTRSTDDCVWATKNPCASRPLLWLARPTRFTTTRRRSAASARLDARRPFLNFYESRKYKTGRWVSIIKCKCNRKPLLLLEQEVRKGYRKLTKGGVYRSAAASALGSRLSLRKVQDHQIHCDPAMIVKKCTKTRGLPRLFLQISYRLVDGKCRKQRNTGSSRSSLVHQDAVRRPKTIRTKCKPGVVKRVTTHIFYTSHCQVYKSKRPRCTQHWHQEGEALGCSVQENQVQEGQGHVTKKCGGSRRYIVLSSPSGTPKQVAQLVRGQVHHQLHCSSLVCVHKGKCRPQKCVRHVEGLLEQDSHPSLQKKHRAYRGVYSSHLRGERKEMRSARAGSHQEDPVRLREDCPKAKIIRKECKPGRAKSVTTHIFYTSPLHQEGEALGPFRAEKIKCKGDKDHVTKCGGSRRYRVVVTIKYIQSKRRLAEAQRPPSGYPCPVKCHKDSDHHKACKKGRKFSVKVHHQGYTVRRACVHRASARHSEVRQTSSAIAKAVQNASARSSLQAASALLDQVSQTRLHTSTADQGSTGMFAELVSSTSERQLPDFFAVCTKRVTKSGVPCFPPSCGDEPKKVKLTKCGGKRRYRSVITTWNTRVGKKCRKHRTVKHYPCPVVCPKRSKTIKRTSCGKAGSTGLSRSRDFHHVKKRVALKSGKARRCKIVWREKKQKRISQEAVQRRRKCRYQLSYQHHQVVCTIPNHHNERKYRTRSTDAVSGDENPCVASAALAARPPDSLPQDDGRQQVQEGWTHADLPELLRVARKYKTGWVCHKKKVQVSIIKCKCTQEASAAPLTRSAGKELQEAYQGGVYRWDAAATPRRCPKAKTIRTQQVQAGVASSDESRQRHIFYTRPHVYKVETARQRSLHGSTAIKRGGSSLALFKWARKIKVHKKDQGHVTKWRRQSSLSVLSSTHQVQPK